VLVPLLWFGPDVIGAGGALDASHTALGGASPESAKNAAVPALEVLVDTADVLTLPALIAAVIAIIAGGPLVRRIGVAAGAWIAIVAAMTVAGYAGNPRYLVAAAALGAALAGVGAVHAARSVGDVLGAARGANPVGDALGAARGANPVGDALGAARGANPVGRRPGAGLAGAAVLVVAVLATTAGALRDQVADLGDRVRSAAAFDDVIAAAGGPDALERCSRIRTSAFARSLVAWRLDLPLRDLDAPPERPAVLIRARWFYGGGLEPPRGPGYRTLASKTGWEIAAACGRAPQHAMNPGRGTSQRL
jgi:hypothetical protein